MYKKDLSNRMTVRFTAEQTAFIEEMADKQAISPSDFVRQCVDFMLVTSAMTERVVANVEKQKAEKAVNQISAATKQTKTSAKSTKRQTKTPAKE